MDSNYTAKLVYSGEGAAVSFDHNVSYFDFANSVRDRFLILGKSIVKLSASGSKCVLSNNVSEKSSVSIDENDYLGCYKPEEAKRYCSKWWENYIKSKDQKFQGGVEEFRLKLRMYAIEMGFEYQVLLRQGGSVVEAWREVPLGHSQGAVEVKRKCR
ncbi:hypothetical protein ACLB2K_060478 [Fragaria x ananassa]